MEHKRLPRKIFLVAFAPKESYCLEPLAVTLAERFERVLVINDFFDEAAKDDGGLLGELIECQQPVVIIASEVDTLSLLRPRDSYIRILIEHGIAPFKAYTNNENLLKTDAYLAPTELWRSRLATRFPGRSNQLMLGGYPRLSRLRELRERARAITSYDGVPAAWMSAQSERRTLVIFTWGVNPEVIKQLPDRNEIIYLFHPDDLGIHQKKYFKHASGLISEPRLTAFLLTHAGQLFGDFSSLTFEALALGISTYFFLDRRIYFDHIYNDLGRDFFRPGTLGYARIPDTDIAIEPECVLTLEELKVALEEAPRLIRKPLQVPKSVLPPEGDNRVLAAELVECVVEKSTKTILQADWMERSRERIRMINFIARSYRDILGRNPDYSGLAEYLMFLENKADPLPLKGVWLYAVLAQSEEGRIRFNEGAWDWPSLMLKKLHQR